MSSNLKIRVRLGSFNVELEGASEEVISQFQDLKKNGLGEMVNQLLPHVSTPPSISTPVQKKGEENNPEAILLPSTVDDVSLQDVVYKMLPSTEKEWVLIYGQFLEKEGNPLFTREKVIKMYERSNRKSDVRIKNLSGSIKGAVKENWITAINDREFMITPKGKDQVKAILSRTEGTSKNSKKRLNKKEPSGNLGTAKMM